MKKGQSTLIWGGALVVVGVLFLLQSLGVIAPVGEAIWAIATAVVGAVFTGLFISDRSQWWTIIPGLSLLGLAALIGIGLAAPALAEIVGVPLFLGAIGASFWAVYLTQRKLWWAIIPGGVLLSVALLALLNALSLPFDVGWVILLGIAATFFGVSFVTTEEGKRLTWALVPAGVMGLVGLLVMASEIKALRYVWPIVMIALGLFFLYRYLKSTRTPK